MGVLTALVPDLGAQSLPRMDRSDAVPAALRPTPWPLSASEVVGGDALRRGGATDLSPMLQANLPAFNFARATIADMTDHLRPITFHGLSPDHITVLINGRRWHTSALVNLNNSVGRGSMTYDLNAVPASALERVEILREGYSARLGSGALGGAVNLVLRSTGASGIETSFGETRHGDGRVVGASIFGSITLGERGDRGMVFVDAYFRDRAFTDRSQSDTRQQFFAQNTVTDAPLRIAGGYLSAYRALPAGQVFDAREATVNRHNHRQGDAVARDRGVVLNSEIPLGTNGRVYFFGAYNEREGESAGFFRRAGDDRTVRALWPQGYLPLIQPEIEDVTLGAAIVQRAGAWTIDLASSYGRNRYDITVDNSNNVSLGANGPRTFDSGGARSTEWNTTLNFSRDIDLGATRPLRFALGGVYREEAYDLLAGDPNSYLNGRATIADGPSVGAAGPSGAQVLAGVSPAENYAPNRYVTATSAEITQDFGDRWSLALAALAADNSDVGSSQAGKVSLRANVTPELALRASVGTGFRAPHLAQIWYASRATNFLGGTAFENRTFPASEAAAQALGATPLRTETSVDGSTGLAWSRGGFSASVDFYRVSIYDRAVLSSNFTGLEIVRFLEQNGVFGVTGGRFFTNGADSRTQGADVALRYVWKTASAGQFTPSASANFNRQKITRLTATPAPLVAIGETTPLFDLTEQVRLTESTPKDVINLTLLWEKNTWSVQARAVRYGEVSAVQTTGTGWSPAQITALTPGYQVRFAPAQAGSPAGNQQVIQTFGAKWILDLDVAWKPTTRLTLSAGANNLADIYPDKNIASTTAFFGADNVGIFPYNGISPFGFNGAFFYGKVGYKF